MNESERELWQNVMSSNRWGWGHSHPPLKCIRGQHQSCQVIRLKRILSVFGVKYACTFFPANFFFQFFFFFLLESESSEIYTHYL